MAVSGSRPASIEQSETASPVLVKPVKQEPAVLRYKNRNQVFSGIQTGTSCSQVYQFLKTNGKLKTLYKVVHKVMLKMNSSSVLFQGVARAADDQVTDER